MKIIRRGSAVWKGAIKEGQGTISTQSGALQAYPYSFGSRFESVAGSNPEELIAAGHAACFTMALALMLGEAGFSVEQLDTQAAVTLQKGVDGYSIPSIHLALQAKIPGADQQTFQALAAKAKAGCPVSKLLKAEITLEAQLV
jgi:lipoyl-dependent peroxiredoxin